MTDSTDHLRVQVQSVALPFTAEGHLLNGRIFVNDGVLKVPDEVR